LAIDWILALAVLTAAVSFRLSVEREEGKGEEGEIGDDGFIEEREDCVRREEAVA
jgi:hypothetical protein